MMIHGVASLGKDKTSEIVSRREVFRERWYVGGLCGFRGCLQLDKGEGTADLETTYRLASLQYRFYFKAYPSNFILHRP